MRIARMTNYLGATVLVGLALLTTGDLPVMSASADTTAKSRAVPDRSDPGFKPYTEGPNTDAPYTEAPYTEALGTDGRGVPSPPPESASVIAGTAGTAEECQAVGGFTSIFSPIARVFRGNRFEPVEPVTVFEFGFRLIIDLPPAAGFDLFFSIHEAPTGILPFTRTMDDAIVHFTQAEASQIYTTGAIDPPIVLEVGKEYIFGVSWGNVNIRYGRATTPAIGSAIPELNDAIYTARYAFNLGATEPPLDPLDLGITPFPATTNGPWRMVVCRTAACCLPDDSCTELSNLACQVALGGYSAPGTTCQTLLDQDLGCPLTVASCCNSAVCAEQTKFECEFDSGVWHPETPFCSDDAILCEPKGACCVLNGFCLDNALEAPCTAVGGTYRGDDTTCAMVNPQCSLGACCVAAGDCELRAPGSGPNDCNEALGQTFLGFGEACQADSCSVTGACCGPGTGCNETTAASCATTGSNYRGDNTLCADLDVSCGAGACCRPGVGCSDGNGAGLDESLCEDVLGGTFQGDGTTCPTIDGCPGICCEAALCTDGVGGNGLDPVVCTSLLSGTFGGFGNCTDMPGPCPTLDNGACCLQSGACVETTQTLCTTALFGAFSGIGSDCGTAGCTPFEPTGACCQAGGVCDDTGTQTDCEALGNAFYLGDGVGCSDPGVDCARGACCGNDGSCMDDVTESICLDNEGAFVPFDLVVTDCSTASCPAAAPCCLPSEDCVVVTQSVCETIGGVFNGGAIECVDVGLDCTRGACCVGNSCLVTTVAGCAAVAGTFRLADGASCVAHACRAGACCFDDGTCDDASMDGLLCFALDGNFAFAEVCLASTCPPAGGCCIETNGGECIQQTEDACGAAGGSYLGDGAPCTAGLCDVGACCEIDGSCFDTTVGPDTRFRFQCDAVLAEFTPILACDDPLVPCDPRGACCKPDDSCDVLTQTECVFTALGTYRGDAITCVDSACLPGACCTGPQACTDTDGLGCAALGGSFITGTDCAADMCPPFGACCLPDGNESCAVMTEVDCLAAAGIYAADDTSCGPTTCRNFACCLPDATCDDTGLGFQCDAAEGIFLPGFSSCNNITCDVRGACCRSDGTCSTVTQADCDGVLGTYLGDNTLCSDSDCTTGACCLLTGNCLETVSLETCDAGFGDLTRGVACVTVPCELRGACCLPDDSCTILTEIACDAQSGTYVGDAAPCSDTLCLTGSCCGLDGTCTDGVVGFDCDPALADFDTLMACMDLDCQIRGACCTSDGTCAEIPQADCDLAAGNYVGDGARCDAALCDTGACCGLDGVCLESATSGECTAANGDLFLGSLCIDIGACEARGACCTSADVCEITTQAACTGAFQGNEILCDPSSCAGGSCCALDGTCTTSVFAFECDPALADFDAADCTGMCELRGACCLPDQTCAEMPAADCDTAGGNYLGDETRCTLGLCVTGACCQGDGTCDDNMDPLSCEPEGNIFLGSNCNDLGLTCEPFGACCTTGVGCESKTLADCIAGGGTYTANGVDCASSPCDTGACCNLAGTCLDTLNAFQCGLLFGDFSQGIACVAVVDCSPRGACCRAGVCTVETASDCAVNAGVFTAVGESCDGNPCIQIVGSDPANGFNDARQPAEPDGANPDGISAITLNFDGDTTGLEAGHFILVTTAGAAPAVLSATPAGNSIDLVFSDAIPNGAWTQVFHGPSVSSVCLAYLPGDANGDTVRDVDDIIYAIDCMIDPLSGDCSNPRVDADRSTQLGPADVLRIIDLIIRAQTYDTILGTDTLPATPCPPIP